LTPLRTWRPGGAFPFAGVMTGALLFMVFHCLFAAREHLAKIARTVLGGSGDLDDSSEAIRHRGSSAFQ